LTHRSATIWKAWASAWACQNGKEIQECADTKKGTILTAIGLMFVDPG
jgi:hypothetical protein